MLIDAKGFYDYDQRESGNVLEDYELDDFMWVFYIYFNSINYFIYGIFSNVEYKNLNN
jgi:hypothetical protein